MYASSVNLKVRQEFIISHIHTIIQHTLLSSIVNRSATSKQEMPTYDRAIRDLKSEANRYRVLEGSDDEGTYVKVQNVRFNNEEE